MFCPAPTLAASCSSAAVGRQWDESNPQPSTPRWGASQRHTLDKAEDGLRYTPEVGFDGEYRLKGVRGDRFEATFNTTRASGQSRGGTSLLFGDNRLLLSD